MLEGKRGRSLTTMPREELARLVGVGVAVLYVILFIVLNTNKIKINFVFFQLRVPLLIGLILIAGLGFGAGWVLRGRRKGEITHPPR